MRARQVVAHHLRRDCRSRSRRPISLAPPWLFTTSPLSPRKTAPLWLLGSRWSRSSSVAGREIRKPIFERTELENARLQQVGDEPRGALRGLERDVARKAVAHDHVDVAARQLVALDEAGEGQRQMRRRAQRLRRFADDVGALHVLGADVEQRDARAIRGRAWCAHRPRPSPRTGRGCARRTRYWRRDRARPCRCRPGSAAARRARGGRCPASCASDSLAIAISAPVLPDDTAAAARPCFTRSIAMPIDVVLARRSACARLLVAADHVGRVDDFRIGGEVGVRLQPLADRRLVADQEEMRAVDSGAALARRPPASPPAPRRRPSHRRRSRSRSVTRLSPAGEADQPSTETISRPL